MFLLLRSSCKSSFFRRTTTSTTSTPTSLFELSTSSSVPIARLPSTMPPPKSRAAGSKAAASTKVATDATTTTTTTEKPEARPRRAATTTTPGTAAALTTTKTTTTKTKGPTRDRESRLWAKGHTYVAGVDEAGRGPLAGPVVAAACVLPADCELPGLDDSKQLDEPAREALYAAITSNPDVSWCVRVEDHVSIDRINILQATMRAMRRAVEGLADGTAAGEEEDTNNKENAADALAIPDPRARRSLLRRKPHYALIDGNRVPQGLPCPAEAVVGGDGKVSAIAAASVLAKVTRDRIMLDLEKKYPGYGLGQHKGYGVPQHVAAVRRLGPSDVHRRSFEPVKSMVGWSREAMLAREAAEEAGKKKEKDDGRGDQRGAVGEEGQGGKASAASRGGKRAAAGAAAGGAKGPAAKKRAAAAKAAAAAK